MALKEQSVIIRARPVFAVPFQMMPVVKALETAAESGGAVVVPFAPKKTSTTIHLGRLRVQQY